MIVKYLTWEHQNWRRKVKWNRTFVFVRHCWPVLLKFITHVYYLM